MPILPFGQYRPDVSDLNRNYTSRVMNVTPRGDGYGPFRSLQVYSSALPAPCRGAFFARKKDGSVAIFAGTATRLYLLDNTTLDWTDVSKGGAAYTSLDSDENWSFAQFGDVVIATQNNDDMQAFTLSTSSEFADLAGSPPRAARVAVVGRFLVASGIQDNPNRVQWSGLNAITTWDGSESSDYQDMPDGGAVRGVAGGEFGIIIQASAIRRMVFVPGSEQIFQIGRVSSELGCNFPWSVVNAGGKVYFPSQRGFMEAAAEGGVTPIGEQRVSATFLAESDQAHPRSMIGMADPDSHLVIWSYRKLGGSSEFDRLLIFDTAQNKWAPVTLSGQYIVSLSQPGVTLEGLGKIGSVAVTGTADNGSGLIRLTVTSTAGWSTGQIKDVADVGGTTEANGTWTITVIDGTHIDLQGSTYANPWTSGGYVAGSVDDLGMSLDEYSAASLPKMGAFDENNRLCFFLGANLEATLETAEQSGIRERIFCSGAMPITDADTVYMSVSGRENLKATPAYGAETAMNSQGLCPARLSTRHMRAKLRIPAGTEWTFATGVEPVVEKDGER